MPVNRYTYENQMSTETGDVTSHGGTGGYEVVKTSGPWEPSLDPL